MGLKADETISLSFEELLNYLRSKTRVFMDVDDDQYYITHTDGYWRVQDCSKLNDKGRFTDCSELVTTLSEMAEIPWRDGKSLHDLCDSATFYESIQEGWEQ
ncbi:CDP-alcohol phosphatidyltransferase [Collinsella tanakaei]|uniref:CDP-alcohol phosphatidyltransferase n=1 Tax=Collinsella tanakaei TaxID=626935 RepID=UPI0025A3745A|nr:CDP-alcohol phosphatidyltransferase [Collinsella tanakaei]MDM8302788.1 CDP-alcohol phosphatidyltransferase [Collinsella tanakaei]